MVYALRPLSSPDYRAPHFWLLGAIAAALTLCTVPGHATTFADVAAAAHALAAKPYQAPTDTPPPALAKLDHAAYTSIRQQSDARLWADGHTPFTVAMLPTGNNFHHAVAIDEVNTQGVYRLHFDASQFDFSHSGIKAQAAAKAGFSGFTVYYRFPKNGSQPAHDQAVLTFHGGSRFRAMGENQQPGAWARGLAIDTGLMSGEEFPHFSKFWLERPANGDTFMVIDALMDSKRATGAFEFTLRPGVTTQIDVQARIFLRANVTVLGVAPVSSMYLFGENDLAHSWHDYRPEAHASDGLQIQSGTGEWLWRPLVNPTRMLSTSFTLTNPQGFGLMQRDRNFADYQDLATRDDAKPSVWVTPLGAWGQGRVELVELPTKDATNDNIVTFWVPAKPPKPGDALNVRYRIDWQNRQLTLPPAAHVTQTRMYRTGSADKRQQHFVIDFAGPALVALAADAPVRGVVSSNANGHIDAHRTVYNPVTHGWRVFLTLARTQPSGAIELRAYLADGQNTVSETWSYVVPAP